MRIFRLELKRVLKSRLTWILLALALILSVLLAYLPTTYCYSNYADESGNEINLTGLASIAYEKERQADAIGIVTPERVREAVEIYQACLTSYGVTESTICRMVSMKRRSSPSLRCSTASRRRLPTRTPAWPPPSWRSTQHRLTTTIPSVRPGLPP